MLGRYVQSNKQYQEFKNMKTKLETQTPVHQQDLFDYEIEVQFK